jgi:hypothetical protein
VTSATEAQLLRLLAQAAAIPPERRRPIAQGDVLCLPVTPAADLPAGLMLLTAPLAIIPEGHGHQVVPIAGDSGSVLWAPVVGDPHVIGVLEIIGNAGACLEQPRGDDRHLPLVVPPGRWELRRQRVTGKRAPVWVVD